MWISTQVHSPRRAQSERDTPMLPGFTSLPGPKGKDQRNAPWASSREREKELLGSIPGHSFLKRPALKTNSVTRA